MKKILSVILAVLISISVSCPTLADDGDAVASLILAAKERFEIDDNEFVFENYSKDDYDGDITYYLSWKSKKDDEYTFQPTISVRIQADGDIEFYRRSREYSDKTTLAKFTEEEAIAKAREYVSRIAPDRVNKLSEGKVSEATQYNVYFERLENGIPVAGDSISLELNPGDLSIDRYSAQWTEAEFPSPEKAIDISTAKEAYKNGIGYELIYNLKTEDWEIEEIYLSYEARDGSAVIDAFTGEAVKHLGVMYSGGSGGGAMANEAMAADSSNYKATLSAEEQAMVDEINSMITKEEAEKLARGVAEFSIDKAAEVTSYSVSKNQYGQYIASIRFSKSEKNKYYSAHASVNAETKEITSFSESYDTDANVKEYDSKNAKDKAEAFLNKYYGDKMNEVRPEFIIGEADKYNFSYDRIVNGIPVKRNGISISVNRYTGELSSFNCTWPEADFPSTDGAFDIEGIYEKVLAEDNFRLQYVTTVNYTYDDKTGKETRDTSANLVYSTLEAPIYSGTTGDEINSRGERVVEKFTAYTDIDGHWCEAAAKDLARAGIYFEGGKLQPEVKVSQLEFLRLVYRAVYGYMPEDSYIYRQMISDGILTEAEMGEDITRIDGIRYFINAMGYKKIAQLKGIYNCPFGDVSEDMKGYASIAGGLGIISNNASSFRPDSLMTRAECITIIHNYLK